MIDGIANWIWFSFRSGWHAYLWFVQEWGTEWIAFLLGFLSVVLIRAYRDMGNDL